MARFRCRTEQDGALVAQKPERRGNGADISPSHFGDAENVHRAVAVGDGDVLAGGVVVDVVWRAGEIPGVLRVEGREVVDADGRVPVGHDTPGSLAVDGHRRGGPGGGPRDPGFAGGIPEPGGFPWDVAEPVPLRPAACREGTGCSRCATIRSRTVLPEYIGRPVSAKYSVHPRL